MKHLKKLGLATAMTLLVTCGMVSSAPATTIDPTFTEVTLASTNIQLILDPENTAVSCNGSLTGQTGVLTHATWASLTITTLTYSNCAASGFINVGVTPSEGCHTSFLRPTLHMMSAPGAGTPIGGAITLPSICSIDIDIPATGCTVTITGGQTIGNGTAGVGGINWTNLNPKSEVHLNKADVPKIDSNGVGFGCPTAGTKTGTLSGIYALTSATNVTVTG